MARSLGEIIGLFATHEAHSIIIHSEVDVFHAPRECHDLVEEHNNKDLVELEKRLGMTLNEALAEGEKRLDPETMREFWDECVNRILSRDHPMLEERDKRHWD